MGVNSEWKGRSGEIIECNLKHVWIFGGIVLKLVLLSILFSQLDVVWMQENEEKKMDPSCSG